MIVAGAKRRTDKAGFREIAKERIQILLEEAGKAFHIDKKLSDRYVEMARKIAMKHRLKIPAHLQKKFCKHCYSYLMPGHNLRIRTRNSHLVYYCSECKRYARFPYKK